VQSLYLRDNAHHCSDKGDAFYFIEDGEVGVSQVDSAGVTHQLPSLKKGQYFGGASRLQPSSLAWLPVMALTAFHGRASHAVPAFAELALLTDKARVATCTAKGRVKVVSLNRSAFDRLLGPCLDILKRNMSTYERISKETGLA